MTSPVKRGFICHVRMPIVSKWCVKVPDVVGGFRHQNRLQNFHVQKLRGKIFLAWLKLQSSANILETWHLLPLSTDNNVVKTMATTGFVQKIYSASGLWREGGSQ